MWPRSNLHSRPEISGDPYYPLQVAQAIKGQVILNR